MLVKSAKPNKQAITRENSRVMRNEELKEEERSVVPVDPKCLNTV